VLLNLTKNSQRAMADSPRKSLIIQASSQNDRVVLRVIDTGHGVADPASLFQPFQEGAEVVGLGLYLSRAFMRAFDGDIIFEATSAGCCFAVLLATAVNEPQPSPSESHATNPTAVA